MVGAPLGYRFVLLGFSLCYPTHTVDPTYDYPPEHWLYFCYLSFLTQLIERVFAEVILQVSWPDRGRIPQSLYALKMRATIIRYITLLVVYGSFEPILGETYLLHSGAHKSSPWFSCFLVVYFLRSVLCVHQISQCCRVRLSLFLFVESWWIQVQHSSVLVVQQNFHLLHILLLWQI